MMKTLYFLFLFLILPFTFTCQDETSETEDISVSKITFTDKGAVIPNPVSAIITVTPTTINYTEMQSGNVIKSWDKSIESTDFDLIVQIINQYDLYKNNDIDLPNTGLVCINTGWSGLEVMIDAENLKHSFKISGEVCRIDWPIGVQELIKQRDELIKKYQP